MENKFLFLDDIRIPSLVSKYMSPQWSPLYSECNWEIVRNFNEFTEWIIKNGIPAIISFDHDLAQEHYAPLNIQKNNSYLQWEEEQQFKEKTGYDCVIWLCDYCMDNNVTFPFFLIHSMNPVGSDKMAKYIYNFKKHSK